MAKKVVATLKSSDSAQFTKVVKVIKSPKGAYTFEEKVVNKEHVKDFFG
jgi:hypothetical protein